jgi:hypothetical protein
VLETQLSSTVDARAAVERCVTRWWEGKARLRRSPYLTPAQAKQLHQLVTALTRTAAILRQLPATVLSHLDYLKPILEPDLLTTNGMLIGISTPYRRLGLLYSKHRDHYVVTSNSVLVVQGASALFNPTLADEALAAQRDADTAAAISEIDALFRTDISTFLDEETIECAIDHGRPLELPPQARHRCRAFVDASGGRHDHYAVAIGHKEGERYVIDVIRGARPPFDPHTVTQEFADLCREYGVGSVIGDAYGAEWVQSAWRSAGISYHPSDLAKSELYLETLPLWTRGLISLPDHKPLVRELRLLERHTHRSGRDTVDHGRNGSDDHANAVCCLLRTLAARSGPLRFSQDVKNWAAIPQKVEGRWISFGVRRRALVNIDQRPGAFPVSPPPEPQLPTAPGLSASNRLLDGTSTVRTPYTELVNTINGSKE